MSNFGFVFDPTQVKPSTGRPDPVPTNRYIMHVVSSEVRPVKSGQGLRCALECEIIQGEYQGRKVWWGINVNHTNPEAQRIGQAELSALCHAIGRLQAVTDSSELHLQPFIADVVYISVERDPQYGPKNEIKKVMSIDEANKAQPAAAQAPTQAAAAAPAQPAQQQPAAAAPAQAETGNASAPPWQQ